MTRLDLTACGVCAAAHWDVCCPVCGTPRPRVAETSRSRTPASVLLEELRANHAQVALVRQEVEALGSDVDRIQSERAALLGALEGLLKALTGGDLVKEPRLREPVAVAAAALGQVRGETAVPTRAGEESCRSVRRTDEAPPSVPRYEFETGEFEPLRYCEPEDVERLEAENARLREALWWVYGLRGEFERPPGGGMYWWRTELRKRAGISDLDVAAEVDRLHREGRLKPAGGTS